MFVYNCQELYVIFSFHNGIINAANNREHHLGLVILTLYK